MGRYKINKKQVRDLHYICSMEIGEMLRKEHSKSQTIKVIRYIGKDSKRFAELMELFLGNEYRLTQRAAWAVSYCAEENPDLITPWLKRMILNLSRPDLPAAVKRNTLKVLSDLTIPKNLQGQCVELCFKFLRSKEETIAAKVHAMSVIFAICKIHPELKNELIPVIKELAFYGGPAIKARSKKVLSELEK